MNDQQTPASAGWGTILLVYLLGVFAASCISQAVPVVGDIARHFHAAGQQVGWIISIPSALVAVGALLTGWIIDRVGDKPLVLVGVGLLVVGDLGATVAESMDVLLLMRVVEGIGYDCVSVATVTMLTRVTSGARRTSALTLWSSYIPMSFAIPLILSGLLAGTGHWRWAFGGHAAVMTLLGILALWLPGRAQGVASARSTGLAAVLRTPGCYALGIAFACAAFVQTGIVSTLPTMLAGQYSVSTQLASTVVTVGQLCNIAGCLLVGSLLNRGFRPLTVAMGSGALTLVMGLAMYLSGLPFALSVVLALLYFLGSGLLVGMWALLPTVAPASAARGAASGLVTQLTLWGVLFGPPAAFAAQAAAGGRQEMVNIAAALLVCMLMLWLVIRGAGTRMDALRTAGAH
jgi:MFS transporter, DHA1 family, inner membrane transport protein